MRSSYGYVSAASIFHMYLTSHVYNAQVKTLVGTRVSVAISNKPVPFYIPKSFPVINGFIKYMQNLSRVPEWMSLGSGWPQMIDQLFTGPG